MAMTPTLGRYGGVTTTTGPGPQQRLDPNVALGAQGVRVAGSISRAINPPPPKGALSSSSAAPDAAVSAPDAAAAAAPGAATAPGAAGVGDVTALSSGAGTGAGETASAVASTLPEDATNIAGGAASAGIGAGLGPGMLAGSLTGYLTGNTGTTASTAGTAVGTVAGSVIGSYIPVVGTMLGGVVGGAIGGMFADGGRAARGANGGTGALSGPGMIGQRPALAGALSGVHGHVAGPGDGRSDSIPAMLSSGEYVVPSDVVSAMGNGSNDAGANALDQHIMQVRARQVQKLQNLPPPRGAQNLSMGGQVSGDPSFATPQAFGASLMNSPYR